MANHFYFIQGLLISTLLSCAFIEPAPEGSLITKLPGFDGQFLSKHYSGYVTIDEHEAKHLFYYFVESERNPSEDPVVLWLGGGPGCSALGAFIYQHGPFSFEASGPFNLEDSSTKDNLPKLQNNPNSWSKVSNVIYLDAPVGVGLSFSLNTSDYTTGDLKTASDTHSFLLKWFAMFPELLNNPFYIGGASYAGVYVPTLASEVMKGRDSGLKPAINLKGYLIGNGVTNEDFDGKAIFPFTHMMGIISDDLYKELLEFCGENFQVPHPGKECDTRLLKFNSALFGIDIYDILAPCSDVDYESEYRCQDCIDEDGFIVKNGELGRSAIMSVHDHRRNETSSNDSQVATNISSLCNKEMVGFFWLNNDGVRKSIHAAEEHVTGRWQICSRKITYKKDGGGMISYHKRLISLGLRVLIYSGDHDLKVPYIGSEAWTRSLSYKIIDEWRPWISGAQVAGYAQEYDKNLTFLTVKGAGHSAVEDKPRETFDFYKRWISGKRV